LTRVEIQNSLIA